MYQSLEPTEMQRMRRTAPNILIYMPTQTEIKCRKQHVSSTTPYTSTKQNIDQWLSTSHAYHRANSTIQYNHSTESLPFQQRNTLLQNSTDRATYFQNQPTGNIYSPSYLLIFSYHLNKFDSFSLTFTSPTRMSIIARYRLTCFHYNLEKP